jgi:hypothetical protein
MLPVHRSLRMLQALKVRLQNLLRRPALPVANRPEMPRSFFYTNYPFCLENIELTQLAGEVTLQRLQEARRSWWAQVSPNDKRR